MTDTNDTTARPTGAPAGSAQPAADTQAPAHIQAHATGGSAGPAMTPPRRRLGTGAIVGIGAGAVAVVAAIALVVAFLVVPGAARAQASGPGDVVRDFMTALTKSDPKTALGHVTTTHSTTYLSKAMVRGSNAVAPLGHVVLGTVKQDAYTASLPVSYTLGSEKFRTTFSLFKGKSGWKLDDPTVALYTDSLDPLGLTLNGVTVKGDTVRVFPGVYKLAVRNPAFTLEGQTTLTVAFGEHPDLLDTKAALSEKGLATFHAAIKKEVDACVASRNLDAGCGIRVVGASSDGTTLVDGTLTRSLDEATAAKVTSMKATPSYSNPLVMEGEYVGSVEVLATCDKGGQQGPCKVLFGGTSIGKPSVDFTSDPPEVFWGTR